MTVTLIIPAFNEMKRLPATLKTIEGYLQTSKAPIEVLVVDDGSTDGTRAHIESIRTSRSWSWLQVVGYPCNRGKGHAVRLGMLQARGDIRVIFDADGSTPIEELPKLVGPLQLNEFDVVIGSRYVGGAAPQGQPRWRRIWSRVGNAYYQHALVPGVADAFCGFKAFTAPAALDVFGRVQCEGWTFDIETLAVALRRGYRVHEVGVRWQDDRDSRVNPASDFFRVIRELTLLHPRLRHVHDHRLDL